MATVTKPIALDESFNTTELTPRNIADVLAQELSRITGRNASQVEYDNTESGLDADNVQDALDEIVEDIPTVPSVDIQTAVDEFETYNGGLLSSLKVTLTPNQDLHGYSEPWVGGAGKNKLPLVLADIKSANTSGTWSGNVYTRNSGTFEVLVDDSDNVLGVKVNGTFTNATTFYIASAFTLKAGSYIYSGDSSLNSDFRYRFNDGAFFAVQSSDVTKNYGSDTNITRAEIVVESGYTVSNITLTPMVRLSTESDPTFEPYSNICPISGHTQVDVDVSDGDTTQEQVTVNLGGTYYSGILDVISGVFTVTNAILDLGDRTWIKSSVRHYTEIGASNPIRPYAPNGDNSYIPTLNDGMCTDYVATSRANIENVQYGFSIHTSGSTYITIRDKRYDELSGDDFKTAISGVYLCYKLATPQTIQLSPTMVKALVGENHLSAPLDGQEITESKYKQMFTFDDVIAYIQSLS